MNIKDKYLNFIRGVSINKVGKTGMVLTTSSFATFIFLEMIRLLGILTNAYIGLITYLLLPTLFVIGLILIPIGWYKTKKATNKTTEELLKRQFSDEEIKSKKLTGSKLFNTIAIFTIVNIVFLSLASMRMLNFMDTPRFCGTACHSVMNPEWTTYQQSPHARVACVECHVGEGVDALIDSKLNGAWQMVSATFDLYEQPIPTPVHQLRPAQETCEKCHWPKKFYGSNLKTFVTYKRDSASTPEYTTLNLKIDTGTETGKAGIHWHIADTNEVRYTSVNDERREMIWVEVKQSDGSFKRYENTNLSQVDPQAENIRTMDCVDCHNRATHIYEKPGRAVDRRIESGKIDRSLPYIKREALAAISKTFANNELAYDVIRRHVQNFYRDNYPTISTSKSDKIDQAVQTLQNIYHRNIHPEMNIDWGAYPSHLGHDENIGCFRCHNSNMVDKQGKHIDNDCTLCHSMLSYDSDDPFKYLYPVEPGQKDSLMHEYLQDEFLHSVD
jgi:hypothetical protein